MARRSAGRAVEEEQDAPRPISTYLLLGLIAAVVIGGAYLNRDSITAFVTNAMTSFSPQTVSVYEPASPALTEPECASSCGSPCWLVSSGAAEGNYENAGGKIGTFGCDGMCWSVSDVVNNMRCCRNSDCPKDKQLCKDGICR